jgi:hypothetical protein
VKFLPFAATLALILPVQAHSWYPVECCSGQDCHETDLVTELPDGTAKVQVGSDIVIVPRSLKRRSSPDGHYHLCYRKWQDSTVVHCFFQPAQA